eukprot:361935-Chlamydomonas_euryale.AAC.10
MMSTSGEVSYLCPDGRAPDPLRPQDAHCGQHDRRVDIKTGEVLKHACKAREWRIADTCILGSSTKRGGGVSWMTETPMLTCHWGTVSGWQPAAQAWAGSTRPTASAGSRRRHRLVRRMF